jgi:hypothetical protein
MLVCWFVRLTVNVCVQSLFGRNLLETGESTKVSLQEFSGDFSKNWANFPPNYKIKIWLKIGWNLPIMENLHEKWIQIFL